MTVAVNRRQNVVVFVPRANGAVKATLGATTQIRSETKGPYLVVQPQKSLGT